MELDASESGKKMIDIDGKGYERGQKGGKWTWSGKE